MNNVNIKIGSVVFDYADYEAEDDVVYLSTGGPRETEGEQTAKMSAEDMAPAFAVF